MKILPAITTIFDWRGKVKEVKELGLKEISLFLTCVDFKERREMYFLLKNTKIEKIPLVHIRSDMTKDEIDYLMENYHTQVLNIHTKREYPYHPDYEKYKDITYIENTYYPFDERELREFAGICLDLAHLENSRLFKHEIYEHNVKLIEKYGCGCSHISPAKNFSLFDKKEQRSGNWHPHILESLSELDYLKKYPAEYFGKFAALEMENSIKEQLEARNYVLTYIPEGLT